MPGRHEHRARVRQFHAILEHRPGLHEILGLFFSACQENPERSPGRATGLSLNALSERDSSGQKILDRSLLKRLLRRDRDLFQVLVASDIRRSETSVVEQPPIVRDGLIGMTEYAVEFFPLETFQVAWT